MFLLHPPVPPWLERTAVGCQVALLTGDGEPDAVWLRTLPDNEETLLQMRPAGRSGGLTCWRALLPWDGGNAVTRYAFKVSQGGQQHWLAADGPHAHQPPEDLHFRINPHHLPPHWVRDQVFYQIFPDRFAQGRPPADRSGERLCGEVQRPVL